MASPCETAPLVVGSGPVALAHALFAARWGPVDLAARPPTPTPTPTSAVASASASAVAPVPPVAPGAGRWVESVPAPLLTLLLELGVMPPELDVAELHRHRRVAWESPEVVEREVRAAAHVERAALSEALWRRVRACPDIRLVDGVDVAAGRRTVLATGRAAPGAGLRLRPRPAWLATTCTVPRAGHDGGLHLAAAPTGYAYRLGSEHWLTVGWVAPGGARPHRAAELRAAVEAAGAGWLIDGIELAGPLVSRVASLTVPRPGAVDGVDGPGVIRLGDAALARDALASQGLSLGLSDARLAARPDWTAADGAARTADAVRRHVRSLGGILATVQHRDAPVWRRYTAWLAALPLGLAGSDAG